MDITTMTRKQFEAVPHIEDGTQLIFGSLVILPTRRKHDSGYRCLDFVACEKGEPLYRLAGGSDVLNLGWYRRLGT